MEQRRHGDAMACHGDGVGQTMNVIKAEACGKGRPKADSNDAFKEDLVGLLGTVDALQGHMETLRSEVADLSERLSRETARADAASQELARERAAKADLSGAIADTFATVKIEVGSSPGFCCLVHVPCPAILPQTCTYFPFPGRKARDYDSSSPRAFWQALSAEAPSDGTLQRKGTSCPRQGIYV